MFKQNEAKALYEFLDRVEIRGHSERRVMTHLTGILELAMNPPKPDPRKTQPPIEDFMDQPLVKEEPSEQESFPDSQ